MYYICIIISTGRRDRAHEMFIESYQVTQTCLFLYPRNAHIIVLYIIFALLFHRTEGSGPWDVHRVVPGYTDVSFFISKKRSYNCIMYYICIIISRRRGDRAHEMFIVSYQLTQRRPPHHKYKDRLNDSKFTSGILVDNWFIIPHTQCTHIKKLHSLWHFIISTRTDSMIPDSYLRFWRTNKSLFDTSNVPISNDFIVKLLTSGKRIWQWNWYFLPDEYNFLAM